MREWTVTDPANDLVALLYDGECLRIAVVYQTSDILSRHHRQLRAKESFGPVSMIKERGVPSFSTAVTWIVALRSSANAAFLSSTGSSSMISPGHSSIVQYQPLQTARAQHGL